MVFMKCFLAIWSHFIFFRPLFSALFHCLLVFLRAEFGSRESSSSDKQLLTIYDLDNKFIAYSTQFDDVVDVVAEWGSFYILTRDGRMFVLQERDTQTKLEVSWESGFTVDWWKVTVVLLILLFPPRCYLRRTCL